MRKQNAGILFPHDEAKKLKKQQLAGELLFFKLFFAAYKPDQGTLANPANEHNLIPCICALEN